MELIVTEHYNEMSKTAADIVAAAVGRHPSAALGLTTGNTPLGLYSELVGRHRSGVVRMDRVRVFCLEEYLGIGPDDQRSLYGWLNRSLLAPCRLPAEQVFRLHGEQLEPQLDCEAFEEAIHRSGGIDLAVEGIGVNAHVGFNEPGSSSTSRTRIVGLHQVTLDTNLAYWDVPVPRYGMTTGIGTLLAAKRILLLASGSRKAEALAKALTNDITPAVPASLLRLSPHLTVVADRQAASLLPDRISSLHHS